MSHAATDFLAEHARLTRRFFIQLGAGSGFTMAASRLTVAAENNGDGLQQAISELESWLTHPDNFRDVSRGKPKPHSLTAEQKREVGLTRETWSLDVISDPEHPATIASPLSKDSGTALTLDALMSLAKTHAVRFPKVMRLA